MGSSCESDEPRLVRALRMTPVVPPKASRRIKGYRHIFTKFEKVDMMYVAFICFAFIAEMIRR